MQNSSVTSIILNIASKEDVEKMTPFLHVFFILLIIGLLFANYMVLFKTSDEKLYEICLKRFFLWPQSPLTPLSYKMSLVGSLVLAIVAYILFILYVTGHLEPL